MIRHLTKTPHGWSLELDEETLARYGIDPAAGVDLEFRDDELALIAAGSSRRKEFEAAKRHVHEKFAGVFRRLA